MLGIACGVGARDVEQGVHAVLHVEVAFALFPVAEDPEPARVFYELLVEIEDMAVGVAFTKDGDEAEDVGLVDLAALGVGGEEGLAGDLARGIEGGLDREGRILGGGDERGLAVGGAGGGEGDALHAVGPHGLEDVEGGDCVLLEIFFRVRPAVLDVSVGGEMKDEVGARHRRGQRGQVKVVAAHQPECWVGQRRSEETFLAGGEIIPARDGDAVRQQAIDQGGPNETGGTGDKNVLHEGLGGQRSRAGPEDKADAKIAERERNQQGKETLALNGEIRRELVDDLVGKIDVFAFIEFFIAAAEPPVPYTLGGNSAGQAVGGAAFRGKDHEHASGLLVEEAVGFADGGGQVLQVLEDVDSNVAVEETVGKIHALLAVSDDRLDVGEAAADFRRHVLPVFITVVVPFLLRGELLVVDVFTQARTDLDRRGEIAGRMPDREVVVETLHQAVALRENLVPQFHELVAPFFLLRGERWEQLGPFADRRSGHAARL